MHRLLLLFIGLCSSLVSPLALAQENRFELSGSVGYTLSTGINVDRTIIGDFGFYGISPKSGLSYGAGLELFVSRGWSVGFNWSQQDSVLKAEAFNDLNDRDITDMTVSNYHGIFTYNFGDEYMLMRPYIFGGLGATRYSPGKIDDLPVDGTTKFSSTWGGGMKVFLSDHLGFRGGIRWTPTYIGSTSDGFWCSWYYCWEVTEAHFSHQFEMIGGIIARF